MTIHIRWLLAAVAAGALIGGSIITAVAVQDASDSIPAERACEAYGQLGDDSITETQYLNLKATFERADDASVRDAGVTVAEVTWRVANAPEPLTLAAELMAAYDQLSVSCARIGAPLPIAWPDESGQR